MPFVGKSSFPIHTKKMNRRKFIGTAAVGLTILSDVMAKPKTKRLMILHTNDTHSRIDPFPEDGGRFRGLGGVARRKVVIDRIRQEEEFVLTLDSGDVFQGTPYYNLYKGEVEVEAMNRMRYDFCAIGNHEFDSGIDSLSKAMGLSRFQWVSSNLDCSASPIAPFVKRWSIKEIGPFRVGLFGLICPLQGMVNPHMHEGVVYLDPVESARAAVSELKNEGCNLIVCLSHVGYPKNNYPDGYLSDQAIPERIEGVDLILGGHSHTFIDELDTRPRKGGGLTHITQQGWGGVRLGKIEIGNSSWDLAVRQSKESIRSA